jgi:hypothetical protein
VFAGRRGRPKRVRKKWLLYLASRERRFAACEIVRNVLADRRSDFDGAALDAAVEAVMRHPYAGDEQIMDFLRWFSSDENPMP